MIGLILAALGGAVLGVVLGVVAMAVLVASGITPKPVAVEQDDCSTEFALAEHLTTCLACSYAVDAAAEAKGRLCARGRELLRVAMTDEGDR